MSDRNKTILALAFFIGALILPLIALGVGWYTWDVKTGIYMMVGMFSVLFILGCIILFRVQDLSWLTVSLPYLFGMSYIIGLDLPLGGDDAVVTAAGSIVAYFLALRKDARTPRWIIIPLLLGAAYLLIGGPIPGGLDEILVNLLAVALAGYGVRRATKEDEDILELEA